MPLLLLVMEALFQVDMAKRQEPSLLSLRDRATVSPQKAVINSAQFHVAETLFSVDRVKNRVSFSHPVPIYRAEALSQVWHVKNVNALIITVQAYSYIPCWAGLGVANWKDQSPPSFPSVHS